jgi:asparagine synthase (glutamine-hydrolysing)
VLAQPKAGFAAPVDYWLAHDLREMTDDLLSESRLGKRGFFRPDAVSSLVQQHRTGEQDWSMQIWQLLTFEIWAQQFIDYNAKSVAACGPVHEQASILSGRLATQT